MNKLDQARAEAAKAKRLVVKIGSGVLTQAGEVRTRIIAGIARQVAALRLQGREVVLVSSGAIAMGAARLGWNHSGRSVPEKQAAAAIGQIDLAQLWRNNFARHNRTAAQILLTRGGVENRERFLNARRTLQQLLQLGAVPVVNENDSVATDEIRFGDNDQLSSVVVNLIGAELLIILTDVDGFYRAPPRPNTPPDAAPPQCYDVIPEITAEIELSAGRSRSPYGRGGMVTKLEAVRRAAKSGAASLLANGARRDVLLQIMAGERTGTLFACEPKQALRGRKHWLAFTAQTQGKLRCDAGAERAIRQRGGSLLPAGIITVEGKFGIGDPVECINARGRAFARGLAAYSAEEIARIKGEKARRIVRLLGYSNGDEVIHRDDLALVE